MRSELPATMTMDPGQNQSSSSGSFYLVNHKHHHNPKLSSSAVAVAGNGLDDGIVANSEQRIGGSGVGGDANASMKIAAAPDQFNAGKSSSKKRSKKKSSTKGGGLNYSNPTAEQQNSIDRINQLLSRSASTNSGVGAWNAFPAGYPQRDDLDLMMGSGKGNRFDGSPGMMTGPMDNWDVRGSGSTGLGAPMPHPMMMMMAMPGQQNAMTNYFTPNQMMKMTPNGYSNSDYSSLPPALNFKQLLLEEDGGVGLGGGGGHDKLRFSSDPGGSDNENASHPSLGAGVAPGSGGGASLRSNNVNSVKRSVENSQTNDSTSTSSGTGASGSSSGSSQHRQRTRSSRSGTGGGGTGPMSNMSEPNGRILGTLLEQINLLHETNSKICRNLHDTKVEIEALKHAPSWGLRHRRDSISGLSTHSQPLGYPFGGGTQSPAPASFHSGAYTPGMMTDVVREVREGARVREDAMLNRVKTMVDERTWQVNELNYKLQREVEELKGHVQELKKERQDTNYRLSELELEIKTMRIVFGAQLQALGGSGAVMGMAGTPHQYSVTSLRNSIGNHNSADRMHAERPVGSTPLTSRQSAHNLNLQYGVLHEQDHGQLEMLPGGAAGPGGATPGVQEVLRQNYNMFGNSNSTESGEEGYNLNRQSEEVVMQMEKDTFDLRRELQDAVAGKKSAEQRILTLEKEMQNMQDSMSSRTPPTTTAANDSMATARLRNFSKSETGLNKFGAAQKQRQQNEMEVRQQANTVQTLVVGSTTTAAAGGGQPMMQQQQSPAKGNGFSLKGPVTDL